MAISVGNTAYSSNVSGGDTRSISYNHTVDTDSNLLIVGVCIHQNSARNYTVTWNGDAMTKLSDAPTSADNQVEMFYILNPDTGTHAVVATTTADTSNVIVCSIDAFVPRVGIMMESDNATGNTDNAVTVSTEDMIEALVVAVAAHGNTSARSPSNGQTEFMDVEQSIGSISGRGVAGYKIVSGVSSQAMNWSGNNDNWSTIGVSFGYKPNANRGYIIG